MLKYFLVKKTSGHRRKHQFSKKSIDECYIFSGFCIFDVSQSRNHEKFNIHQCFFFEN